ncbi:MAG: hypothetical protein HY320_15940 [Armatimonadetes bacterium]|nr:hypothetical protein [Armatimonadota bacterium]
MIEVRQAGERRQMEFAEFVRLARSGWIHPGALVISEVLTAGRAWRAYQLRTYALARGLPPPPALPGPANPTPPELSRSLARMGHFEGAWVNLSPPVEPALSDVQRRRRNWVAPGAIFLLCAAAGYALSRYVAFWLF